MKKVVFFLTLICIMIVCTFGAGCISTAYNEYENNNVNVNNIIISETEEEFDKWMNKVKNPPEKYWVYKGILFDYNVYRDDFYLGDGIWIEVLLEGDTLGEDPLMKKNYNLKGDTLYPMKNGVKLDSASKIFVIKDDSLSLSTVTMLTYGLLDGHQFTVLHLIPEDYNNLVELIKYKLG